MHLAKAESQTADHLPSQASIKVLPAVHSLENLRCVVSPAEEKDPWPIIQLVLSATIKA